MEENPYKAPVEVGSPASTSTSLSPGVWRLALVLSTLMWGAINVMIFLVLLGWYDPPDGLPLGWWCVGIAGEWLLFGGVALVAFRHLRRLPKIPASP